MDRTFWQVLGGLVMMCTGAFALLVGIAGVWSDDGPPAVVVVDEWETGVPVDPLGRVDVRMAPYGDVQQRCDDMGGVLVDTVCVGVDY